MWTLIFLWLGAGLISWSFLIGFMIGQGLVPRMLQETDYDSDEMARRLVVGFVVTLVAWPVVYWRRRDELRAALLGEGDNAGDDNIGDPA